MLGKIFIMANLSELRKFLMLIHRKKKLVMMMKLRLRINIFLIFHFIVFPDY